MVNQTTQNYSNGTPFQILYELKHLKIEIICSRGMEPYKVDLNISLVGNGLGDFVIFDKRINVEEDVVIKGFGSGIVDHYVNKLKEKIN